MIGNGVANFEGDCGEKGEAPPYRATCRGGMQIDQSATVNGSSPGNCIIANDGAKVFAIELVSVPGPYDYQVRVDAQGPSGPFSGFMYLAFKDMTDDVYYLKVWSKNREWHIVDFNSKAPAIQTIYWCDKDFDVALPEGKTEKAQYRVESPASNPAT
jgi:hypothetical protein